MNVDVLSPVTCHEFSGWVGLCVNSWSVSQKCRCVCVLSLLCDRRHSEELSVCCCQSCFWGCCRFCARRVWMLTLFFPRQAMVETVNNLLQPQARAAWMELSSADQLRAATMLLDTVEQGAFVLADNLLKTDVVQENTENIRKSLRCFTCSALSACSSRIHHQFNTWPCRWWRLALLFELQEHKSLFRWIYHNHTWKMTWNRTSYLLSHLLSVGVWMFCGLLFR